jgi:hypothetical protein
MQCPRAGPELQLLGKMTYESSKGSTMGGEVKFETLHQIGSLWKIFSVCLTRFLFHSN